MRSSHGLHGNSICLALTALGDALRIEFVPEMAGQSPWKRLEVSRHQNCGRAFGLMERLAARLIPRSPGACSVIVRIGSGFTGYAARTPRHWRHR
jgi:hypothetical protein